MTMRERLARALAKSLNQQSIGDGSAWELDFEKRGIDYDWEEYLLAVGALLTELEKPSAGVIEDGNTEIENCIDSWNYESGSGYSVEQHAAHSCIKAMIKAIREGK